MVNTFPQFKLSLLCLLLVGALQARAQEVEEYRQLWTQGQYQAACQALAVRLDETQDWAEPKLRQDYAQLLEMVGRVDEAIAVMRPLVANYPATAYAVQLAQLYQLRGRPAEYRVALEVAQKKVEMRSVFRPSAGEWVALGKLMELRRLDPQEILAHYRQLQAALPEFVPGLLAAADLALGKRAYDVAASQYGQALQYEPENQAALAGLARCYRASGDGRAAAVLAQLKGLNPHHPRLLLLRAEKQLDLHDIEGALTPLNQVLAVNPNHLEALALKGAALFLLDRPEQAQVVRQEALAFNPHWSGVYRIAGRVASRHYRFRQGQAFQQQALGLDSLDSEARTLLALDLLRLGADQQARGQLEQVFAADPYNVRAYNLLEVADAIEQFQTVENDLFKIQMPLLESRVLGDEVKALLAEAATQLQDKYQFNLRPGVVVQLFGDHDEFMVRSVGLPGSVGHLGICFGRVVTLDSPRARPDGGADWRSVLWHEFVHVITLEMTDNRLSRWLSEGISVYEEEMHDPSWGQRLDPAFAVQLESGYPGLDDLERFFVEPRDGSDLLFGYFAAGQFVRFYVASYGFPALVETLRLIGAQESTAAALVAAAGITRVQLDEAFGQYLQRRCRALEQVEVNERGVRIDPASPFARALQTGAAAAVAGDTAAAAAAYQRAEGHYPDYSGADAPRRRLVQLHRQGDSQDYARALQQLVAWDAKAHQEALELAGLEMERGRWPEALWALQRASGGLAFTAELHRLQVECLLATGRLEEASQALRRLAFLDPPRRRDHRLQLAHLLRRSGAVAQARREVLELLQEVPHFWAAQQLLLELAEEDGS